MAHWIEDHLLALVEQYGVVALFVSITLETLGFPLPGESALIASGALAAPKFQPIPETTLLSGSPLHIALDGSDPSAERLTYSVVTSDSLVTAKILKGNRSLRIKVAGFGQMVFELFDGRARRATNRIVELANQGFYNGVIFHRVIDDFVIQGGDPLGTGAGGSFRPDFDDQFHVDAGFRRSGDRPGRRGRQQ